MTYTYGDVKIGDLTDSELVTMVERFAGGDHEFIRITVKSGGRRTEKASHPAGPTDHRLDGASDEDLTIAAGMFADHYRDEVGSRSWARDALWGVALEMNRRSA